MSQQQNNSKRKIIDFLSNQNNKDWIDSLKEYFLLYDRLIKLGEVDRYLKEDPADEIPSVLVNFFSHLLSIKYKPGHLPSFHPSTAKDSLKSCMKDTEAFSGQFNAQSGGGGGGGGDRTKGKISRVRSSRTVNGLPNPVSFGEGLIDGNEDAPILWVMEGYEYQYPSLDVPQDDFYFTLTEEEIIGDPDEEPLLVAVDIHDTDQLLGKVSLIDIHLITGSDFGREDIRISIGEIESNQKKYLFFNESKLEKDQRVSFEPKFFVGRNTTFYYEFAVNVVKVES